MGKNLMPEMKMKIKSFAKMTLVFEFFISKLDYMEIFMEIKEKKLTHF